MEIVKNSYMYIQYIKRKETQMDSDLNINKCNLTKYTWERYKNEDECMSRKPNKLTL